MEELKKIKRCIKYGSKIVFYLVKGNQPMCKRKFNNLGVGSISFKILGLNWVLSKHAREYLKLSQ